MKILIAVDGSGLALDAVHHGLQLHRDGLRAQFILVTVQPPTYLYERVLSPDADVLEHLSGTVGARALEAAEQLFVRADVAFESEVGFGDPAPALLEIVERRACQMIILGARGLGVMRAAVFGSVSLAVLQASKVPVTIVKHIEAN